VEKETLSNIYTSENFLLNERKKIFNRCWQIAAHVSEIPNPGDYITLNVAGEPLAFIRGDDHAIRGFYNICIHRGFPLLDKSEGFIAGDIRCSYHGWKFNRHGELTAPRLDSAKCYTLKTVHVEVFAGFIFFNLGENPKSVTDNFGRWKDEFTSHELANFIPHSPGPFEIVLPVNWKIFLENTLEGSHLASVHAGLDGLIGSRHPVEFDEMISKTVSPLLSSAPKTWSEKLYHAIFHKSQTTSTEWIFYFLFPNVQITVYPEQIIYLQSVPINAKETMVRGRYFRKSEISREHRAAAYLNQRIGRKVFSEDLAIVNKLQKSFDSLEFTEFPRPEKAEDAIILFFNNLLQRHTKCSD